MEKQFSKDFVFIIALIALLGGLASALNDEGPHNWKKTIYRTIGGAFGGLIFGFLVCHFIGEENKYLVLSVTGAGATLGIDGLRVVAEKSRKALEIYISKQ